MSESRIPRITWILRYLPSETDPRLGEVHTGLNGSDFFPYLIFIEKRGIIEISIDAEVIVGARSLNIDSMKGGKHYARSYPSDISRTDRL